jgi:hypothetical protein
MWGRLFGRGRDDGAEISCAQCGRTVLAGEWTQRLSNDDDEERILCSLCADVDQAQSEPAAVSTTPAGSGRVKATRSDSDVFWKALKDKDAEIERLNAHLLRAEAERQELAGRLAQLQRQLESAGVPLAAATASAPPVAEAALAAAPAERTQEMPPVAASPAEPAAEAPPVAEPTAEAPPVAAPTLAMPAMTAPSVETPRDAAPSADVPRVAPSPSAAASSAAAPTEPEFAGDAAHLTLLQRGVDLLNVSPVPRRIAETNENLGMPTVNIGFDGRELVATFMWSMGWYQFAVSLEGGGVVRMLERGYEQRTDMRPNASVRPDGTVHLAAAQIKRPSATQKDDLPPGLPLATKGEILSKSMMGQRTDDEPLPSSWEQAKSGDFDWGR